MWAGRREREREIGAAAAAGFDIKAAATHDALLCMLVSYGRTSLSLRAHTQKHTCRHPSGKDVYSRLPWQPPALFVHQMDSAETLSVGWTVRRWDPTRHQSCSGCVPVLPVFTASRLL